MAEVNVTATHAASVVTTYGGSSEVVAHFAIVIRRRSSRDILRRVSGQWPFVGRARELTRVDALLNAGVGALVLGEPGVGKSAFARELGRRASSSGVAVSQIVGHAVSTGTPFEVFAGALAAQPGRDATGLGASEVLAVTDVLGVTDVVTRLFATLGRLTGRPPILIVDDIQLIDDQSAQVLLRIAATSAATVIATAPDEARLPAAVDRLWRDGLCERVELAPLSDDEIGTLLEAVLGGPVEHRTVRAFTNHSGGNALFAREMLTTALDRSLLVRRGVGDDQMWTMTSEPPVSRGIREIVTSRLAGLPDAQRHGLELVAAGEPLTAAVAADLIGDAVLDELAADRLVAVRDGLAGPEVSTAHPIYGDLLRTELPGLRLHRLRLAIAGRLESDPNPRSHDLVRAAVWRLDSGQGGDAERLVTAARAARRLSLATAERLARHAYETSGSLPAALLLAEVLTHSGRADVAAELMAQLPPESLGASDREAIAYCMAMGQGVLSGEPGAGAELIAGVLAGAPAASDQLRSLYAAMLAFDGRFEATLAVAMPIIDDPNAAPTARTMAALGAVGATYWLGRYREAVALADRIAATAASVRDMVPFGFASIELIAICAYAERGDFDLAEARARTLKQIAESDHDLFAGPRGDYCLGRIALLRGQVTTARRLFARCLVEHTPFDQFIERHLSAMFARAAVACGEMEAAASALAAAADKTGMKTYEPEDELAQAAVLAASLRLDDAAERAAWAAGVAASQSEWSVALTAYHDAARYGGARQIVGPMREAVPHVDSTLGWCYLDHAVALAARDAAALDEVARRFEAHGALMFAAEAQAEAALEHAADGDNRAARASSAHATWLWNTCEAVPSPWLTGSAVAVPLTVRERQVAALAAIGLSDAAIAERLGISIRTVQTHLGHVYDKLGSAGRTELAVRLAELKP